MDDNTVVVSYTGDNVGTSVGGGMVVVSYTDDNVKNNSPKYFGRLLLSVDMVGGG